VDSETELDVENKKILSLPELELQPLGSLAHSLVAIPTELSRLPEGTKGNHDISFKWAWDLPILRSFHNAFLSNYAERRPKCDERSVWRSQTKD
jgi:hypothetical protein